MSYSLALGPSTPTWRGPQRILVRVDGERIADVEYRDEQQDQGVADQLAHLDLSQALERIVRTGGSASVAHSLAFCQALEQLCGIAVTERVLVLRTVAAEYERAGAHLRMAADILEALGMDTHSATLLALEDTALRAQEIVSGTRAAPDICIPGGVRRNLPAQGRDELLALLPKLNRKLYGFTDKLIEQRALLARTVGVGTLPRTAAEQFGVRGPLARASGLARDARIDHPYAAYSQYPARLITQDGGDVYARLVVLLLEALESVKLVEQLLQNIPSGEWQGALPRSMPPGEAIAAVEAPRGMLRYHLESDGQRLTQVRVDAPRQLDRLLARTLLSGAQIDNLAAIVVSCDPYTPLAER